MSEENELPEGWVQIVLENVAAPKRISTHPMENPTLPFIGMEHVEAETMKLIGTVPASELKSNALRFWTGDVLYGRLRPYLNKVFRPDFEGLCSAEFLVFRESPNLDNRYLQYFLNSWSFKEFASHLNEGDRPRVDWDQLKVYPLLLPPLLEQHRIVAAIEQQFTRLDSAITALQHAKAKLKRYRASVLKAAVEGKLTEAWRAEHPTTEPASVLLERILVKRHAKWEADLRAKGKDPAKVKYVEPAMPDVEKLPEVPEGWCWATVEQLGNINEQVVLTGPFGSNLGREDFINSGVPVLTIGCLTEKGLSLGKAFYISEIKANELERYRVKAGDLLFSRMASVGRSDLVSSQLEGAIINYHLMRLRLSHTTIDPNYFITYVRGSQVIFDYIKEVNHGVTRDGINTNQLLALPVALAPFIEQQEIVSEVERRLSIVTQVEATVNANLKRAERLRQSILKEAFAGRLVPQDPNDEPASVLLERIHKEREGQKPGPMKKARTINTISVPRMPDVEPMQIDASEMEQMDLWANAHG